MKDINSQSKEAPWSPSEINKMKSIVRCIIVNLLKARDKEKKRLSSNENQLDWELTSQQKQCNLESRMISLKWTKITEKY